MSSFSNDTSVKVAVRIRPLNADELSQDDIHCINAVEEENQIIAGSDFVFTFDHVFGVDANQSNIYEECVVDLVNAAFEGFNATILAYGQTGSGKTWTMGSSADLRMTADTKGIIPRVIETLFQITQEKEAEDENSTYKIQVQFIEIYGEDIKDLLDQTRTSKVAIRETPGGEVFISGAREELVSSPAQMMKALEDGTKNRTTASTRMNQSSSRSHAIFTVIIEHTMHVDSVLGDAKDSDVIDGNMDSSNIQSEIAESTTIRQTKTEVRKSKFHFVDLAGSERAKRTGAQGTTLKEGIDINKGLLALGNVISALGDETKRGKVHVPYRDSKLTRILQDSLGGNSKTLFICCVSPAGINFFESLNALRYANRARNIKNKPIVNRDPTLVMIEELKAIIRSMAIELLMFRKNDSIVTEKVLSSLQQQNYSLLNEGQLDYWVKSSISNIKASNFSTSKAFSLSNGNPGKVTGPTLTTSEKHKTARADAKEVASLKMKLEESTCEIHRLSEQIKLARNQASEMADKVYFLESERDFFKMKWADACPEESRLLLSAEQNPSGDELSEESRKLVEEKVFVIKTVSEYVRQIDKLKQQVAELKKTSSRKSSYLSEISDTSYERYETDQLTQDAAELLVSDDNELSSSVARVIAQTQKSLKLEAQKLKAASTKTPFSTYDEDGHDDELNDDAMDEEVNQEERSFQMRQKIRQSEVAELGESILLKEQLVQQLQKSQYQYAVMKSFYESKLQALEEEMLSKENERESLLAELQEVTSQASQANQVESVSSKQREKEEKLREELKKRDEELKNLRKRQEELNRLSQVQNRFSSQLMRLESDISAMKKQRVELTKTLQSEKKKHMSNLNEKAKEIERLKRELSKKAVDVKRLGMEKERAEDRAREAMREGAQLRKRANEMLKFVSNDSAVLRARTARKAMSAAASEVNIKPIASSNSRFLSEEQMKTKQFIDKWMNEITSRDRAAESLRRACEQQLSVLRNKDSLEAQKLKIQNSIQNNECDDFDDAKTSLIEIDEQLESIDEQLKLREEKIVQMQDQLAKMDLKISDDRIMESLKKLSAGNLNQAHDLVRLLFSMMVNAKRIANSKQETLDLVSMREKRQKEELDDLTNKCSQLERSRDQEVTRVMAEYEERLRSLFSHSSVGSVVLSESKLYSHKSRIQPDVMDGLSKRLSFDEARLGSDDAGDLLDRGGRVSLTPQTSKNQSLDGYKMLLSLSTEQCDNLRSQLLKKQQLEESLSTKVLELEHAKQQLSRELEEKNSFIAFLEDERQLFREMADDLRSGLVSLDGTIGTSIIKQVREKVIEKGNSLRNAKMFSTSSISASYLHDENGEDDDDSESVLNEFENIALEINRTGGISKEKPATNNTNKEVYERLTNPSNFTGTIKQKFEKSNPVVRSKKVPTPKNASGNLLHTNSAHQLVNQPPDLNDDDDTESLANEFNLLADEIFRTGSITQERNSSNTSIGSTNSSLNRTIVYDRLTNPSNYTGSMKMVFDKDLATKKQKVMRIKNQERIPPRKEAINKNDPSRIIKDELRVLRDEMKYAQMVDYLDGPDLDNSSTPVATSLSSTGGSNNSSEEMQSPQSSRGFASRTRRRGRSNDPKSSLENRRASDGALDANRDDINTYVKERRNSSYSSETYLLGDDSDVLGNSFVEDDLLEPHNYNISVTNGLQSSTTLSNRLKRTEITDNSRVRTRGLSPTRVSSPRSGRSLSSATKVTESPVIHPNLGRNPDERVSSPQQPRSWERSSTEEVTVEFTEESLNF